MFNCLCDKCFKEFPSNKFSHICDDCRTEIAIKNSKNKASLCFNCTNYWTCGKKGSIIPQDFMIKYEIKTKKYPSTIQTYECLTVYECQKYKTKMELTQEEIAERKSKYTMERFVTDNRFM